MYLQNCGLRTFSYEILSKEVLACENIRFSAAKSVEKRMFSRLRKSFFSAFLPVSLPACRRLLFPPIGDVCTQATCLRVVNFLLRAQEFKQGSLNLSRYQINFYRFVPIKLYFERLANDSVLHGTV